MEPFKVERRPLVETGFGDPPPWGSEWAYEEGDLWDRLEAELDGPTLWRARPNYGAPAWAMVRFVNGGPVFSVPAPPKDLSPTETPRKDRWSGEVVGWDVRETPGVLDAFTAWEKGTNAPRMLGWAVSYVPQRNVVSACVALIRAYLTAVDSRGPWDKKRVCLDDLETLERWVDGRATDSDVRVAAHHANSMSRRRGNLGVDCINTAIYNTASSLHTPANAAKVPYNLTNYIWSKEVAAELKATHRDLIRTHIPLDQIVLGLAPKCTPIHRHGA